SGIDPGPLAGVPFTVKDTITTAGVRTTAGSRLYEHHVPTDDAACVALLRAAGAVLIGKTNCPEFALQAHTDNLVFGATHHPDAPEWSPGGSSGGCAAAVASGIVPISIGGDYGGSVRYPASCTGIFGLRPTRSAVDPRGTLPPPGPGTPRERFQTVGPLAHSIRDAALAFGVLTQAPAAAPAPNRRVGIVRGGWPVDHAISRAVERAAATAESAGYELVPIEPDLFVRATDVFDAWRATDPYDDLRALAAGREAELTPHIRALIAGGTAASDRELGTIAGAAAELERLVAAVLAETSVIVLPVSLVGVLPIGATHVEVDGQAESLDSLRILGPSRAISLLGLPALAVPAGVDDRGLPVGVQLVGCPNAEADLFSVAQALAPPR
ncbi:MAG: amidase, partial [Actinomycetota bacterium]|nr:amidase [Actinomycetota bacterium]